MSSPFLGEIRMVGFNFAPRGWAMCNGQILPISQNTALFALLGTNYGGNGQTTFALPDLRSRKPLHFGQGPGLSTVSLGEEGGVESVTLSSGQMPQHSHTLTAAANVATTSDPTNTLLAGKPRFGKDVYTPPANLVAMNAADVGSSGGSNPHDNMQPYLVVNFVIALQGIFPSRN
ncbi:MAG TPA: tail fiber protein [Burkholderiales bacterium]|nr:tail fiber protein [Burkholderiales bacterium]